jgi:hypothetical protein
MTALDARNSARTSVDSRLRGNDGTGGTGRPFSSSPPAQAEVHLVRSFAEFTLTQQNEILRFAQDDIDARLFQQPAK